MMLNSGLQVRNARLLQILTWQRIEIDSSLQSRFALDLYPSKEMILYPDTELCFTRFISEQRAEIWPLVQVINTLYNCISVKFSCNSKCWTHRMDGNCFNVTLLTCSIFKNSLAKYINAWIFCNPLELEKKKKMLDFQHNVALSWKNVATTITTFQPIG